MTKTVSVIGGNIVTPKEVIFGGFIVVVDGKIQTVSPGTSPPVVEELRKMYPEAEFEVFEGGFILPGFVDIHNHGLGGADDVIGYWTNPEYSLRELARCGTLCTLASIIFSSAHAELVRKCIKEVEARVGKDIPECCLLGGIHAEGPIIKDAGGLPECESYCSLERFEKLCASMRSMRIMTISPRIDSTRNYELIKHLLQIKVRPSLGHDRVATKREILGALKLAKSEEERFHITHMHNVMSFDHREPSLINVSLCSSFPNAKLYRGAQPPTVEIIGDLIHVDALAVQATISARGADDVSLISDCIAEHSVGKRIKYNGRPIVVRAEGGCVLCDKNGRPSQTFAGGTSVLADQFMNLITLFRVDLVSACKMVATNPAKVARLHDVGSIEAGKRANLLIFNSDLNTITRRMIHGKWTSHGEYRLLRPSVSHM